MVCKGPRRRDRSDVSKEYAEQPTWGYAIQCPAQTSRIDATNPIAESIRKHVFCDTEMLHHCKPCKDEVVVQAMGMGFIAFPEVLVVELRMKHRTNLSSAEPDDDAEEEDDGQVCKSGRQSGIQPRAPTVDATALEPVLDVAECVHKEELASSAVYRLQSVIKRFDQDGKPTFYSTYTRTSDAKWWKCEDELVSETAEEEAWSLVLQEKPCLLFYEKMPAPEHPSKTKRLRR